MAGSISLIVIKDEASLYDASLIFGKENPPLIKTNVDIQAEYNNAMYQLVTEQNLVDMHKVAVMSYCARNGITGSEKMPEMYSSCLYAQTEHGVFTILVSGSSWTTSNSPKGNRVFAICILLYFESHLY